MKRSKDAKSSVVQIEDREPPSHLESLISDLTCKDVYRCRRARRELVVMGEQAVPSLVAALTHSKGWTRWEAAKALGQIDGDSATAALVGALEDSNFDIRWLAAEGLIRRGRTALRPLLEALMKNPESVYLREGVHHVLHDIEDTHIRQLSVPLLAGLEDVDSAVLVPRLARALLEAMKRDEAESSP